MSTVQSQQKVDRELLRQLQESDSANTLVEAIFGLRPPDTSQRFLSAFQTEEIAHQLLERVGQETGLAAHDCNVFKNLGSFVVAAPSEFIRRLLEQGEISSAMANRQAESPLMPPRNKKSVSSDGFK